MKPTMSEKNMVTERKVSEEVLFITCNNYAEKLLQKQTLMQEKLQYMGFHNESFHNDIM